MVTECNFVGHVVKSNGVKPQQSRISDFVNFNRPNNLAELRWQLMTKSLLLTFRIGQLLNVIG